MGRSADSKLEHADRLNTTASKIRKKDPESARELDALARVQRKSAIRQLKRRPKSKKTGQGLVIGA
ncbi:hypothetical protein LCGC14_2057060 [marine sediment metagenome]|uniref:Uncharacterized protein n=1 Tax=marine sediment metagenome TaxID=412755 RepID=A0A0F9HJA3_9ZZZZ